MRILHTADWHLGKNLEGQSRLDEQERFIEDFIEIANKHDVDVILIAGDIYDSYNPPARAEKLFYDALKRVSANGERLIIVISGNHDNPDRLVAAGPLAMEHGIIMAGTPKTVVQPGDYGKHKVIESGEGYVEVEVHGERAVILTVPYPSEKRLNEVIYQAGEEESEHLVAYTDRLKSLFDNLEKNYREDTINLMVSHLFAMNSVEEGTERSISLGGSYIVGPEIFPKKAQYIALGHVHKPQIVPGDRRIRYSGSPIHFSRNETAFKKKVLIIDVKAGEECSVNEVPLDVYKPIEVWRCKNIEEALQRCEQESDNECYVYLEIETDRVIRDDEIKQMKCFKQDVLSIYPIMEDTDDSEIMESVQEKSFEELFRGFYKKQQGTEVSDETMELLLEIMQEDSDETN